MSTKKLEEAWRSYEARVLPGNASEVQRRETRRGFYAGAEVALNILLTGVSNEPEITPGDEALMTGLQAELDQFCTDVLNGEA